MLFIKLISVGFLIGLTVVHDLIIGPRVVQIKQMATSAMTETQRQLVAVSPWVARTALFFGLVVILSGTVLVRL